MNVVFQKSKNNEDTALINNTYIHSNYNPTKEAERFVSTLTLNYKSKFLIITEPGLSHCVSFLREKFPQMKIGCIRYLKDFENYNSLFDFSINYFDCKTSEEFEFKLCSILNEEDLLSTTFIKWEPACKILQDIDISVWKSIKNSFEKSKTLLITRQYFEKKWFYNSILYFKYINSTVSLNKKITIPVFIISSGPSLNNYLDFINKNQNKVFIICLSSAISVCLKNNIIPDLLFSTDGGYWAGQHLKKLYKYNIPLALPAEAFCPKKILEKNPILPVNYMDGLSSIFFKQLNLNYCTGKRNGTVSGTALEFALENSISSIYFFGLDLSTQKGFQHTQPNELYLNNLSTLNKTDSEEKASVKSEYSSGSLNIYCNWFKNFNSPNRKIFRVIDSEYKHNSLGNIMDINLPLLSKKINNIPNVDKKNYFFNLKYSCNKNQLKEITQYLINDENVKKQLYPMDYIHYFHENDLSIINKISSAHKQLENKIWKLFND